MSAGATGAGGAASRPAGESGEALELVHYHPGRLRVRAGIFRADDGRGAEAAARVRDALESLPGITQVGHGFRTGSLLVEYEPGLAEPDAILARIADAAGLERYRAGADPLARRKQPALVAIEAARELNTIAYELTGWRADLRSLVPAGLAALAAVSLRYGKDPLPRWDNLLYWSYNLFVSLHRQELEHTTEAGRRGRHDPPAGDKEPEEP